MFPNSNLKRKRVLVIDRGVFASSYADFVNAADIGEITLNEEAFLLNPDDFTLCTSPAEKTLTRRSTARRRQETFATQTLAVTISKGKFTRLP